MDKLRNKLIEHLESYDPPRYNVNIGNCLALMLWAYNEGKKNTNN